ncbi:MAG: alpha/beta fold hydrolase [Pseudorhodobacter sp.]|nr:alpha/beta fold hydrolase [Pseudorhodobacter sp.]
MAQFLLIHGSCHGAWCWDHVLPFLNIGPHQARAIDLPARGADRSPIAAAALTRDAQAILAAITRPVILVGHSMAGYPITAAAELAPEKIVALVYLCAYVPRSGMSLADMRRAGPHQPLAPAIRVAKGRQSFSFDPERIANVFYHDCPAEALELARRNLCPEPITPQETPLILTGRSANVARHYIRCTEDRAIPPAYQQSMTTGWPAANVTTLSTSHSPFFAAPQALAQRLIEIAETI